MVQSSRRDNKAVQIAVMGAAGFAGQLVIRELKQRDVTFVVADKDKVQMEKINNELGGDIECQEIDLFDKEALEAFCSKAQVLINCAGPYTKLGQPVIDSVIEGKTHYIDFSDEISFINGIKKREDEVKKQGITILNSVGMGGALGDIAAALAATEFDSVDIIEIVYVFQFAKFSRGTLSSMLHVIRDDFIYGYENEQLTPVRLAGFLSSFDYPEPIGHVMGVSAPGAEILIVPWHIKTKCLRVYGVTAPWLGRLLSSIALGLVWLARSPVGKLALYVMQKKQFSPSEKKRKAFRYFIQARVTVEKDGKTEIRKVMLEGNDGYLTTARLGVNIALQMLEPSFKRSGVLTIPQAFDLNMVKKILSKTGINIHSLS